MKTLVQKYNVPGPRYTSYPTVPYWDGKTINDELWKESVQTTYQQQSDKGISIYIHLPFCESLCTFCGCHKRITKNHKVEEPYITTVLKEWELYTQLIGEEAKVTEIHLGGGTPTFFSAKNLEALILGIKKQSIFDEHIELSFEAHPNNTSKEQLQTLYDIGFRRVSFGIQDYNEKVQKTINRVQSFEQVERVHNWSKEIGYTSISHDLVFGLPFQTAETITDTIEKTNLLKPDRLSFYSYAHVPWIKGLGQRGYSEEDLPKNNEKRALYELGKEKFQENGYLEVGMDHFSLPKDDLLIAQENKRLHRNFMGYTTTSAKLMIGLGMSAISDSWIAFVQNVKSVEEYTELVNNGQIPIFRGHGLTQEDEAVRTLILDLMCKFEAEIPKEILGTKQFDEKALKELAQDEIVVLHKNRVEVTELGKAFIRNVCMCFDLKLQTEKMSKPTFSKTI